MWFQRLVEEVDEPEPTFEAVPITRSSSSLRDKIPKAQSIGSVLTPRDFKRVRLMRKVNNAKLIKELAMKEMEAEREREHSRQKMEAALSGLGESQRALEEESKDKVVEKFLSEQAEITAREAREKEERQAEYKFRLAEDLRKSGMDEEQISVIMKREEDATKEEGSPSYDPDRPTYTRMSRKHLSIETLNAYRIDYEFDEVC